MSAGQLSNHERINVFLQEHCAVTVAENRYPSFPYSTEDLLDAAKLPLIIGQQSAQLGEPAEYVVGTLFAKRYSVLIMGLAASISLFDTPLSLRPGALRFRLTDAGTMRYEAERAASGEFPVNDMTARQARLVRYQELLLEHLRQIFGAVSGYTGAKEKVMWSLVAHNLHTLYGRLHAHKELWDSEKRGQVISQDYKTLLQPEKPDALSMQFRRYEHPQQQSPPFYLRTHCCLAYLVKTGPKAGEYCSTCPRLSPEERRLILHL